MMQNFQNTQKSSNPSSAPAQPPAPDPPSAKKNLKAMENLLPYPIKSTVPEYATSAKINTTTNIDEKLKLAILKSVTTNTQKYYTEEMRKIDNRKAEEILKQLDLLT